MQAAIWIGTVLCVWLAFVAPPSPVDTSADRIVAQLIALALIGAVAGFELYLRLYVLEIAREGNELRVTTLATMHHRRVRIEADTAELGQTHHERAPPFLAPGYDNSWQGLRAKGHWFPFIVDTTP